MKATRLLISLGIIAVASGCNVTFGRSYTAAYLIDSRNEAHPVVIAGSTGSTGSSQAEASTSVTGDENMKTDRKIEGAAAITDVTGQGNTGSGNAPNASGGATGSSTNTQTPTAEGIEIPAVPGL
jgi:hypothetical protein